MPVMADRQFLLVEAGGERLAIPSNQVHEIRRRQPHEPHARPSVDLAEALGLPSRGELAKYELAVQGIEGTASLVIQQAQEVVVVGEGELLPLPPLASELAAARGIKEGLVLGERVVLVVDLNAIVAGLAASEPPVGGEWGQGGVGVDAARGSEAARHGHPGQ